MNIVEQLKSTPEYLSGNFDIVVCPSCGNFTLNNYYICPCCAWEYDGVKNEGSYSSTNGCTLHEYIQASNLNF